MRNMRVSISFEVMFIHSITLLNSRYICQCILSNSRELLNRHMKTHTAREHTKEDFQVLRKLAPKKDKVTNRKNNYADGTKKNESGSKNRKTNKPTNVGTKKCAKPSTELPFPCDICEQSFETLVLLYRHKRYLHKPKRFKCPVCDKCFAYRYVCLIQLSCVNNTISI